MASTEAVMSVCGGQRPSSMSSIVRDELPTQSATETPPAKSWNPASTPTMPLRHDFWRWNSTLTSAGTPQQHRFNSSIAALNARSVPTHSLSRCVLLDRTTPLHLNKHQPGQAAKPASQPIAAAAQRWQSCWRQLSPRSNQSIRQVSGVDQPSG